MGTTEQKSSGELREGYAEIGDVRLHYVEAGEGPLIVLLHGFPEFWYGWRLQIEPLAAAGFRVVAPDMRGYNLSSTAGRRPGLRHRQAHRRHPRSHPRTRCPVRAAGRSRLGRNRRLGHRDEPPRGRGPAGHPQRGPSAEALAGTAPPGPAPQVLVLLLLRPPGAARSRRARQPLAFLPALPARRPPGVHAGGDRPLRRGVVAAGRSNRDDQLLPVLGAAVAEEGRSGASPDLRRPPWSSGGSATATSAPNSPSPSTTTYPTWTASSACPTRRTGSITTRPSASTNCSSTSSPRPNRPRTADVRGPFYSSAGVPVDAVEESAPRRPLRPGGPRPVTPVPDRQRATVDRVTATVG